MYIKGKDTSFLTTSLWPCMNLTHNFLPRYPFLKDGTMKNNSVFKSSGFYFKPNSEINYIYDYNCYK